MSTIKRNPYKSYPSDATSTFITEKSTSQDAYTHKSGFEYFSDIKRKVNESYIANVQEGIVYYVLNDGKPMNYWMLSTFTRPKSGHCIKAFCKLDASSKVNPKEYYEKFKSQHSTETEKNSLRELCLCVTSRLDTFAPLKEGQPTPNLGDRVRLHFFNDPLLPSGEKIRGYYEVLSSLPSFDVDQEYFNFIKNRTPSGEAVGTADNIVVATNSNTSQPVNYSQSTTGMQISISADEAAGIYKPILDLLVKYEGGPGGWDSMYPSTKLEGASNMTLVDVSQKATGAVGMYQNLPSQIVKRAKAIGLDPQKDLYNDINQTKIAVYLIGEGQAKVKPEMLTTDPNGVMLSLAKVWAAIPVPEDMKGHNGDIKKGQSYYAGDGKNTAHITTEMMLTAIQESADLYEKQNMSKSNGNNV